MRLSVLCCLCCWIDCCCLLCCFCYLLFITLFLLIDCCCLLHCFCLLFVVVVYFQSLPAPGSKAALNHLRQSKGEWGRRRREEWRRSMHPQLLCDQRGQVAAGRSKVKNWVGGNSTLIQTVETWEQGNLTTLNVKLPHS